MQLRVLGCSGGMGGNARTATFLLDNDVLFDAGTGVSDLSFEELLKINHVFLTHSHMDHLACLPILIDSVGFLRESPIRIYALPETLQALKQHIFNWTIWPDLLRSPMLKHL